MQIVIELSDETYKDIKEENSIYGINNGLSARITGKVVGAIQNGKPLPKGHGDLIDISKLPVTTTYFGISDKPTEVVIYNSILNAKKIIKSR